MLHSVHVIYMAKYAIVKPSFWKSRREVLDHSKMMVAYMETVSFWQNSVRGEAPRGNPINMKTIGWDDRKTQMTDASGTVLGTITPKGFLGTRYVLMFKDKEYQWKLSTWGTGFSIFDAEGEVMSVRAGGYFKPGSVEARREMPEKEMLPLVLFGIYQVSILSNQASVIAAAS